MFQYSCLIWNRISKSSFPIKHYLHISQTELPSTIANLLIYFNIFHFRVIYNALFVFLVYKLKNIYTNRSEKRF